MTTVVPSTSVALKTKAEVNYRKTADEERNCHTCVHRIDQGDNSLPSRCALVEGTVEPNGVCDLWEAGQRNWAIWDAEHPYLHHPKEKHSLSTPETVSAAKVQKGDVVLIGKKPRLIIAVHNNGNGKTLSVFHQPIAGGKERVSHFKPKDPIKRFSGNEGSEPSILDKGLAAIKSLKGSFDTAKPSKKGGYEPVGLKPVPLEDITSTLHPTTAKGKADKDLTKEYEDRDLHAEGEWAPRTSRSRYGVVTFDNEGRVLLREPTNHFGGYHWQFSKGTPDIPKKGEPEEAPLSVAQRETLEETGHQAPIVGHVPGGFSNLHEASPTVNHYYLAHDSGQGIVDGSAMSKNGETAHLRWATPQEALNLLSESSYKAGAYRELQTYKAASEEYGKLHPELHLPPIILPPPPKPKYGPGKMQQTFEPDEPDPVRVLSTSYGKFNAHPFGKGPSTSVHTMMSTSYPGEFSQGQQNFLNAQKAKKAATQPPHPPPMSNNWDAVMAKAKGKAGKKKREEPELEYRSWAVWDEEHPYVRRGRSVHEVVDALEEGHHVGIDKEDVPEFFGEINRRTDDQLKSKEEPRLYDLGKVHVRGTHLFTDASMGYSRGQMPQLSGFPEKGSEADKLPKDERGKVHVADAFRKHLEDMGVKVTNETVAAQRLRPTQSDLNAGTVASMYRRDLEGKMDNKAPIWVSKDNYILDGHHRWAMKAAEGDKMNVIRVDMPGKDLFDHAREWTEQLGIKGQSAQASGKLAASYARSSMSLSTRDWTKWNAEHPYVRKGRRRKTPVGAQVHFTPKAYDNHLRKQFVAQDRDVLAKAHQQADQLDPGHAFTGTKPMDDTEYEEHRLHVEFESTRHGGRDLLASPFSTHNSEDRYKGVEGLYTPSRRAQHEAILHDLMERASSVPSDHQAIVMGGLGGSGKSTMLRRDASNPHSVASKLGIKYAEYSKVDNPHTFTHKGDGVGDPVNYAIVNPDDIKEEMVKRGMIPKIDHLSPMEAAGSFAHEEASQLADELDNRLTAAGKNVIYDITLNSVKSGTKRVNPLHQIGPHHYHVAGAFVDVSPETSAANARERHRVGEDARNTGHGGNGGRYVPTDLILNGADPTGTFRSKNRAAFEQLKSQGVFDHTLTIDNEGYAGKVIDETGHSLEGRADFVADAPQTSDITDLIHKYNEGRVSRQQLVKSLSTRDYALPDYFTRRGATVMDDDVDFFQPGTWGEVVKAHDFGLLPDDLYQEIADKAYAAHS